MLKIDLETTITLLILVIFVTSYENFILLIGFSLGVALTLLMNPIGHYFGVRKEFRVVQFVYLVTNIALPIYLVYSV
jgi:purine-cytosine permease-like protein